MTKTFKSLKESKKNRNNSIIIGIAVSFLLFLAIPLTQIFNNYNKSPESIDSFEIAPPPPPPPAPEVIEVVEDEEEIEETVIESTETDQEEIVEVEVLEEEFEDVDVPFAIIEDVPIYPGCENVPKSKRRDCFQEQINKHIRKNFRYPEIAQEMGIQGRVFVSFIISKDGTISNIRKRGPDKNLEREAERIISKLPKMTPGKQRGRAVRVPFSIPITFRLQ